MYLELRRNEMMDIKTLLAKLRMHKQQLQSVLGFMSYLEKELEKEEEE